MERRKDRPDCIFAGGGWCQEVYGERSQKIRDQLIAGGHIVESVETIQLMLDYFENSFPKRAQALFTEILEKNGVDIDRFYLWLCVKPKDQLEKAAFIKTQDFDKWLESQEYWYRACLADHQSGRLDTLIRGNPTEDEEPRTFVKFDKQAASDGMQKANGDSEFLGRLFNGCPHSKLGQEVEILSTVSKERRHNRVSLESDDGSVTEYGVKQKRPELSGYAKVVYSEPLQYFDRDMFLKFCDLGWKNISDDETTCIVPMPKLCKDMFGSKRPKESEEKLIIDSLRRLARSELVDFNVQVVKSKSTENSQGRVTKITRQPFLSFSEGRYEYFSTGKEVKCFIFPASSKFILYEYAKDLGRIRSFTPDLIPPAMPRTESSYNLYCILRDRMSWFDPKNPYRFKFDEFFDPSEVQLGPRVDVSGMSAQEIEKKLQTAIRGKRRERTKEIKKILDYWSQKGVCRYELIKEKRPGKKDPVDIGWKFTEVNREMMIGKIPLLESEENSSPKETE